MIDLILRMILKALIFGLILSPMVMSLLITYRTLKVIDVSLHASITWGGIISALLIIKGIPWHISLIGAIFGGMLVGTVMAFAHVYLKINDILAGILVAFAGYALAVLMIGEKISLLGQETLFSLSDTGYYLWGCILLMALAVKFFIDWFLSTDIGLIMQAVGCNEKALWNVSPARYRVGGIVLSNGIIALSGAILAQYEGASRSSRGNDMIIDALTAFIIGFSLFSISSGGLKKLTKRFSRMEALLFLVKRIKPTTVALIGCLLYYVIYYIIITVSPQQELPKLILAVSLLLLLGDKRGLFVDIRESFMRKFNATT